MLEAVDDVSFVPFRYRDNRFLEEPFALILPGTDVEMMPPREHLDGGLTVWQQLPPLRLSG
jgi:hypothetical protein